MISANGSCTHNCPACQANAWAKPDTNLVCGDCDEPMQAEEPEEGDE